MLLGVAWHWDVPPAAAERLSECWWSLSCGYLDDTFCFQKRVAIDYSYGAVAVGAAAVVVVVLVGTEFVKVPGLDI
jgi:hypothetical protein